MKKYAFFDFDGTLISQDSFMMIVKEGVKSNPLRALFLIIFLPVIILLFLFKLDRSYAKSLALWSVTFGKSKKECILFFRSVMNRYKDNIWFLESKKEFERLKALGCDIVVVTASGQSWARVLLREFSVPSDMLIGSRLGYFCFGVILTSKNCYRHEKINRIQKQLGTNFSWYAGYTDHIADLPMLLPCQNKYIICPKPKHLIDFKEFFNNKFELFHWTTKANKG